MEGCSKRKFPPPPPPTSKLSKKEKGKALMVVAERRSDDISIVERSRRGRMNESYALLQTMVPNVFPKATKAKIVDETVSYVQKLKGAINLMEEKKRANILLHHSVALVNNRNPSVDMTVFGKTAFFGLRVPARPGLATQIFHVFEKRKAEVLSTTIAQSESHMNLTITALVEEEEAVAKLKNDILLTLS